MERAERRLGLHIHAQHACAMTSGRSAGMPANADVGGMILVVEDDSSVRDLLVLTLELAGYRSRGDSPLPIPTVIVRSCARWPSPGSTHP